MYNIKVYTFASGKISGKANELEGHGIKYFLHKNCCIFRHVKGALQFQNKKLSNMEQSFAVYLIRSPDRQTTFLFAF